MSGNTARRRSARRPVTMATAVYRGIPVDAPPPVDPAPGLTRVRDAAQHLERMTDDELQQLTSQVTPSTLKRVLTYAEAQSSPRGQRQRTTERLSLTSTQALTPEDRQRLKYLERIRGYFRTRIPWLWKVEKGSGRYIVPLPVISEALRITWNEEWNDLEPMTDRDSFGALVQEALRPLSENRELDIRPWPPGEFFIPRGQRPDGEGAYTWYGQSIEEAPDVLVGYELTANRWERIRDDRSIDLSNDLGIAHSDTDPRDVRQALTGMMRLSRSPRAAATAATADASIRASTSLRRNATTQGLFGDTDENKVPMSDEADVDERESYHILPSLLDQEEGREVSGGAVVYRRVRRPHVVYRRPRVVYRRPVVPAVVYRPPPPPRVVYRPRYVVRRPSSLWWQLNPFW